MNVNDNLGATEKLVRETVGKHSKAVVDITVDGDTRVRVDFCDHSSVRVTGNDDGTYVWELLDSDGGHFINDSAGREDVVVGLLARSALAPVMGP